MSTLIKIPTESYKKIEIPDADVSGKMSIAVVAIKDLPRELDDWRSVNPREVNLNSGVSKQIRDTLDQRPDEFILRNRGITILVSKAEFDNRTNVINIELTDREREGVLDGGHTLLNIWKYLEDEEDPSNAYVRLEILENIGDIDETVKIVDARNRSTEVKIAAFENLLGHFDTLKHVLDKEPYAEKIAYKENELSEDGTKKEVPIEDVLSYVLCFDVEDFDHNNHPTKAYSGKNSVVKHFQNNVDKMQKYLLLAPEILELRDRIYEDLPLIWNSEGNEGGGGKAGKIRGIKVVKEPKILPFTGNPTHHVLSMGFVYPALAAFRPLVKVEAGRAEWRDNPIRVYNDLRGELIKKVVESALRTKNPNETGKNLDLWGVCYSMVEREVLTRKL